MELVVNIAAETLNIFSNKEEEKYVKDIAGGGDVSLPDEIRKELDERYKSIKTVAYVTQYDIKRDDPFLVDLVREGKIPDTYDPNDEWNSLDPCGPSFSRKLRIIVLPDTTTDWKVMLRRPWDVCSPEYILYVDGGKMHEAEYE